MKIAVYGISKNEDKHVDRFMDSMKDVDLVSICDTGSTDNTVEMLRERGAVVHETTVAPFRFDLARNSSLMELPSDVDIAISMDIDEVLMEGWRDIVEEYWVEGETTMLRYPFVHNWVDKEQKIPSLSVWGFKVHCPKTYIWKYPMHETLEPLKEENQVVIQKELIRHYPDMTKTERIDRIKILKEAIKEYPDDQRMAHLYARELFFHHRYDKAIEEFKRHLKVSDYYVTPDKDPSGVGQTRASSCRKIAQSLMALNEDPNEIIVWLLRGVSEYPYQRETWMALADGWYVVGDFVAAYACARRGMDIDNMRASIEVDNWCWDDRGLKFFEECRRKLEEELKEGRI